MKWLWRSAEWIFWGRVAVCWLQVVKRIVIGEMWSKAASMNFRHGMGRNECGTTIWLIMRENSCHDYKIRHYLIYLLLLGLLG